MTISLDWWQLGWALAGFLGVMVLALAWSNSKRGSFRQGYGEGLHDRQHWESDEMLKAAIHTAFDKK